MPGASSIGCPIFRAVYRHGVDERRRVQIPSKWRPAEGEVEFTLILWPRGAVKDACLLVLPPVEMEMLLAKIKAMPFADPKAEALRRRLGRNSDQAVVDKVGRISLPDAMSKAVGIGKEALMIGLLDRFEIWNPERYEATCAVDDELSLEAFKLI